MPFSFLTDFRVQVARERAHWIIMDKLFL